MRINVLRDRDFTPEPGRIMSPTVAFTKGEVTTKREWGEALVAAGDATEVALSDAPKPAPAKAP